ncbi:hypothetical protein NLI96_g879 [Meripilus lineatus]|uniref:O-methylsterigmatocystin oxidoreductase n=1 Tax=Meripilus lineatus TaxID=2056292 RepID=A0AAD5YI38_9APHY|nr:hypothetical protein NLI96_g879 [Physisporinus lineatus]
MIYSDRPTTVMAGELVGWDRGLGYTPLNARFRDFRKFFHQTIGSGAAQHARVLKAQEQGARHLLGRLLDDPSNFIGHFRHSAAVVILRLLFGYDTNDAQEKRLVQIVEDAMQGFARASEPGAWAVDYLPWLKYIPTWFPGASFKVAARRMWADRERMYNEPFDFVKKQMDQGKAIPSFTSDFIQARHPLKPEEEEFVKAAAASLYSGGADTTPSSLSSFVLAITLNPSIQRRAQLELDTVLGKGFQRLPAFSDRANLPYVNAIVLEVLRWNPAVPLGLAHKLAQDDIYEGYHLRKGTVVWANIWYQSTLLTLRPFLNALNFTIRPSFYFYP